MHDIIRILASDARLRVLELEEMRRLQHEVVVEAGDAARLHDLQRVGRKGPVFVLDELEARSWPPSCSRCSTRPSTTASATSFVELPFDLSEVLVITTANDPDRILCGTRSRGRTLGRAHKTLRG